MNGKNRGQDPAVIIAQQIRKRKFEASVKIQRFMRKRISKWKRREQFAGLLCGPGSVYEYLKLSKIMECWRVFTKLSKERWKRGYSFSGLRPGYRWVSGARKHFPRRIVVYDDRVETFDTERDSKLEEYFFRDIKHLGRGKGVRKDEFSIHFNDYHIEVYLLVDSNGFERRFQQSFGKWKLQERRELMQKRLVSIEARRLGLKDKSDSQKQVSFRPETEIEFPTLEQAKLAVGDVGHLPPPLQKALDYDGDHMGLFAPIQSPWLNEWLYKYPHMLDKAETYPEWKDRKPDIPNGNNRNKIYLISLGDPDEFNGGIEMRRIQEFVATYFHGLQVVVLPTMPLSGQYRDRGMKLDISLSGFPIPPNSKRVKYNVVHTYDTSIPIDTIEMQEYLKAILPFDAFMLIGITLHEVRLGAAGPKGNSLLNFESSRQAAITNRVATLSLARLDPWFQRLESDDLIQINAKERYVTLLRRSCVWIAHHIMAFFGMRECTFHKCCMNGFTDLDEKDIIQLQVCPVCLRKLFDALGIRTTRKCIERYNRLRVFCHVNSVLFKREAKWYGARSRSLEKFSVNYLTQQKLDKITKGGKESRASKLPKLVPTK